jgi:hypothetical protein
LSKDALEELVKKYTLDQHPGVADKMQIQTVDEIETAGPNGESSALVGPY